MPAPQPARDLEPVEKRQHDIEHQDVERRTFGRAQPFGAVVAHGDDVALGVEPAAGGNAGAMGLYAILRAGLSINRIAGRPVVAIGPLKDVDLQAGVNLQTKNSAFAPNERTFYAGPNFQFRFGQAFVNVAVQVRQEWNRNGILGRDEDYGVGVNISPVWNIPFRIGGAQLVFDGFADYNSAKGRDVTGHQTKAEFLARPQLKLDISRLAGQPSRVLELGVGLEYWHNMFGKNADTVPGASQLTPIVSLNVHLPTGRGGL